MGLQLLFAKKNRMFIRFITGPSDLGDVPVPSTPPKMFVNTDSEQEELILVVYKVGRD